MIVTFESEAHADITMFGDIAVDLIRYTGHSGTVPGALSADQLETALNKLQRHLHELENQQHEDLKKDESSDEEIENVSVAHRAGPLVKMLELSIKAECPVMWTSNSDG